MAMKPRATLCSWSVRPCHALLSFVGAAVTASVSDWTLSSSKHTLDFPARCRCGCVELALVPLGLQEQEVDVIDDAVVVEVGHEAGS